MKILTPLSNTRTLSANASSSHGKILWMSIEYDIAGSSLPLPTQITTQEAFTDTNYRYFFGLAVDVVLRPWEKLLMGLKFTEVGYHLFPPGFVFIDFRS
jgi:hypothetical protein